MASVALQASLRPLAGSGQSQRSLTWSMKMSHRCLHQALRLSSTTSLAARSTTQLQTSFSHRGSQRREPPWTQAWLSQCQPARTRARSSTVRPTSPACWSARAMCSGTSIRRWPGCFCRWPLHRTRPTLLHRPAQVSLGRPCHDSRVCWRTPACSCSGTGWSTSWAVSPERSSPREDRPCFTWRVCGVTRHR